MKKTVILIFFLFLAVWNSNGNGEMVDRIVAIVNDDAITLSELEEAVAPVAEEIRMARQDPEEIRRLVYKVRQDILESMIEQKLTDQESKRLGISVAEEEIDSRIERIKSQNFFTDEELRKALEAQGYTLEEYKKRVRDQILQSKIINQEVKSKIAITDDEIETYLKNHQDLYSPEKKYHLRAILVKVPSWDSPDDDAAALQKIEVIMGALKDASFSDVAKQYSEDASGQNGGDLGFFSLSELTPELQETIRWMKEGDISPALQTPQGYQVILVEKIQGPDDQVLKEVKAKIERKLYQEKVEEQYKTWLDALRKRSFIKRSL